MTGAGDIYHIWVIDDEFAKERDVDEESIMASLFPSRKGLVKQLLRSAGQQTQIRRFAGFCGDERMGRKDDLRTALTRDEDGKLSCLSQNLIIVLDLHFAGEGAPMQGAELLDRLRGNRLTRHIGRAKQRGVDNLDMEYFLWDTGTDGNLEARLKGVPIVVVTRTPKPDFSLFLAGADDFVCKPELRGKAEAGKVRTRTEFAVEMAVKLLLIARSKTLEKGNGKNLDEQDQGFAGLLGHRGDKRNVYGELWAAGSTDSPVILEGSTGVGKGVFAHALHLLSARWKKPFQIFQCGTLPEALEYAELFGAKRGAYTGCDKDRVGAVERAEGGTLLVDEFQDLSPQEQNMLLRLADTGEYRRLGDEEWKKADVRLVLATNRTMEQLLRPSEGRPLRKDLYWRVAGWLISIPALVDRENDVWLLWCHFLKGSLSKYHARGATDMDELSDILSDKATDDSLRGALERNWKWPGNVRQLRRLAEVWHSKVFHGLRTRGSGKNARDMELSDILVSLQGEMEVLAGVPSSRSQGAGVAWVLDVAEAVFALRSAMERHASLDELERLKKELSSLLGRGLSAGEAKAALGSLMKRTDAAGPFDIALGAFTRNLVRQILHDKLIRGRHALSKAQDNEKLLGLGKGSLRDLIGSTDMKIPGKKKKGRKVAEDYDLRPFVNALIPGLVARMSDELEEH